MHFRRPRTLLSLTLLGIGLVTLPLLVGAGNAMLKLNDLMAESRTAVRASEDFRSENQRMAQALTNMNRYARQYVVLQDRSRLEFYQAQRENADAGEEMFHESNYIRLFRIRVAEN